MVTREEIVEHLTELGVLLEWSSANLLAVDVPDLVEAQPIADYLQGSSSTKDA